MGGGDQQAPPFQVVQQSVPMGGQVLVPAGLLRLPSMEIKCPHVASLGTETGRAFQGLPVYLHSSQKANPPIHCLVSVAKTTLFSQCQKPVS